MASNELALYTSFEEEIEEICVLCGTADNKPSELGKKITFDGITAHHFCMVSVSYYYRTGTVFQSKLMNANSSCESYGMIVLSSDFVGQFEAVYGRRFRVIWIFRERYKNRSESSS